MIDKLKGRTIAWILKGVPKDGVRRKIFISATNKELKKYLKEDNEMEGKKWYESKTLWAAIVAGVLGMVQPVSTALGHPVTVPMWVYEVLGAFGLYGIRDAVGKQTPLK